MLRYAPRINDRKAVPVPIVTQIAQSILQGLRTLHKLDYIHTDIKPENIALKYFLPEISSDQTYQLSELLFGNLS